MKPSEKPEPPKKSVEFAATKTVPVEPPKQVTIIKPPSQQQQPLPQPANNVSVKGDSISSPATGKSVGVIAKLSTGLDKRQRIDNLGRYHEYKPYPERAKLEETVYKSLNEVKKSTVSLPGIRSVQLPPGKAVSRAKTNFENDIRGFIPDGPASIAALINVTHFFIKDRCCFSKRFQDVTGLSDSRCNGMREVVNNMNRRMFFIMQTKCTAWWSLILLIGFIRQDFQFMLYDCKNGRPALIVDGRQYLFGVYSTAHIKYPDGTHLAVVKQSVCDGSYKIKDDKDRIAFTLIGPVFACYAPCVFCCCDEEFEILLCGSADEMGRCGRYWPKDEFPDNSSTFGVSFPQNMPVRSKVVIIGAGLLIRYQYFIKLGNGLVLIPLYLILIFLGFFLFYNCFGYCSIH